MSLEYLEEFNCSASELPPNSSKNILLALAPVLTWLPLGRDWPEALILFNIGKRVTRVEKLQKSKRVSNCYSLKGATILSVSSSRAHESRASDFTLENETGRVSRRVLRAVVCVL